MTNTMFTKIDKRTRAIVCEEDNKIFYKIVEAEHYYGLRKNTISSVLAGRCKAAGGLHFRYATEEEISAIKKNITVQDEAVITGNGKRTNGNTNPVLCLTTGEIFTSGVDAAEKYEVTPSAISRACRNKNYTAAGHRFCYIKDINEYVDVISGAINRSNAYDILIARDATRRELVTTVNQERDAVTAIEFKLCEIQRELEEAKHRLACAENNLRDFDA